MEKKEVRIKSFAFPRFVFIDCWLILSKKEKRKKIILNISLVLENESEKI